MITIAEFIISIEKSLRYIIDRGTLADIPEDKNSYEYSDTIDYYDKIYTEAKNKSYILFVDNKCITIDCTTDTSTAEYVLRNIKNIGYVYCETDGTDTIIGNVKDIMKKNNSTTYKYIRFIMSLNHVPQKNECLEFLEELNL